MRRAGLGLMSKLMGQGTWALRLRDRRTMVANGTMGLFDRRVLTRNPWAMEHGAARQTAPLTCCGIPESLLWHGGLLWQKTAQWGLSATRRAFFEPWIEALIVPQGSISGSARHFGSKTEAPLLYFLTKRARFCALGPHCGDFCHLPWDIIKGQGSEGIS